MDPNWEISPEEAAKRIKSGEQILLLDCRRDEELKISAIDGALHIPLDQLPKRLSELDEHEDKDIVVFCHAGVRSFKAAIYLRDEGFETARSMHKGINEWARTVDPSLTIY